MRFEFNSELESGCLGLRESNCLGLATHLIDWSGIYLVANVLSPLYPPNIGFGGVIVDNFPIGPLYPGFGEFINGNVLTANKDASLLEFCGCGQAYWNFDDYDEKTWVISAWQIERPSLSGFWEFFYQDPFGNDFQVKLGIKNNITGFLLRPQDCDAFQLPSYGATRGAFLQINKPIVGVVSEHTELGGGILSGPFNIVQPQVYVPLHGSYITSCAPGRALIFWIGLKPSDLPAGPFDPAGRGLYFV